MTFEDRRDLSDMRDVISSALSGHLDNTMAPCRGDLNGHDCCYICNAAQDMLEAFRKGQA